MDMIAFGVLAVAAVLTMAFKSLVDPTLLALAMTQLLQLSGSMQWAVRQTAEAENHMTSVERILAYCCLQQERDNVTRRDGAGAVAKGWPQSATVHFDNVQVRLCSFFRAAVMPNGAKTHNRDKKIEQRKELFCAITTQNRARRIDKAKGFRHPTNYRGEDIWYMFCS
jgi:ABC-type multidrug transport system fused ATPase/permease subunit